MEETVTQPPRRRAPRGIIIIGMLLIVAAFFVGGVGTLFPSATLESFGQPRSLLLVGALVTAVLAYGLLRLRRWAWFATLSFVFVNAYFLLLGARVDGSVQYPGLIVLLMVGAYMLLPGVRAVFLKPAAASEPRA